MLPVKYNFSVWLLWLFAVFVSAFAVSITPLAWIPWSMSMYCMFCVGYVKKEQKSQPLKRLLSWVWATLEFVEIPRWVNRVFMAVFVGAYIVFATADYVLGIAIAAFILVILSMEKM